MKTRNIAFKLAVLAAVLAAGYAFGFAKGGGSRTAKGKP
ncbi:NGO1622 family putative holin, partial [Neisseria gonorrhoeae]